MLSLQGLAGAYNGTRVFEHVDLELGAGEVVAILGESGVGKSTLLNLIAGLDHAAVGSVTLAGRLLTGIADEAAARIRREAIGFVFQAFHVLPYLNVERNVALPLLLLQRPDATRVQAMIDAVGLEGLEARLPRQLSGGQLQRVAIARALVHKPRLILADEPTGNLDPTTAERVLELLLTQTRAEQAACVLVTHSATAAARADRMLRLSADGLHPC